MTDKKQTPMMKRKERKLLMIGVAYGLGIMCGKHNLTLSKKEVKKIASQFANQYQAYKQ
jgi:hypothetical protein